MTLIENNKAYKFTAKNEAGWQEQIAYIEDEIMTFEELKNSQNQTVEIIATEVGTN